MKKYVYKDTVTGKKVYSDTPIKGNPALVLIMERKDAQMKASDNIRTA